ncbi:MAG: HNH endonuclease [Cetobacterium sp.]
MKENYLGYMVEPNGSIYKNGKRIASNVGNHGYERCKINRKDMLVHRVVAIALIENPEALPTVNHIDGNKLNNSVTNLEWVSHKDNEQHKIQNLNQGYKGGVTISLYKDGEFFAKFKSVTQCAKFINGDRKVLSKKENGDTYKGFHIYKDFNSVTYEVYNNKGIAVLKTEILKDVASFIKINYTSLSTALSDTKEINGFVIRKCRD